MKVLVTGGTGYIGEHFVPELLKNGCKVRLLVRNIEKARSIFGDKCDYHIGDITDRDSLRGCCQDIDIVYHMVAKVGNDLPSKDNYLAYKKVNVDGTENILEEAKLVKRFVYISSIAAMGIVKQNPISESSVCNPYLPYQVTKYEAEQVVLRKCNSGFPGIIIRPTKVYGVGEHEYSYMTLTRLCKKGVFIKVGMGKNYSSNIYITDFVQVLIKLLDKGKTGEIYILSGPDSISFEETGRIISSVLGKNIIFLSIPAWLMILSAYFEEKLLLFLKKKPIVTKCNIEATVNDRIYDLKKAKNELEYNPQVCMADGIKRVIIWYKEEKKV